jgi:hypothetical protein
MGAWLPITLVAMTQIAFRFITVAGVVWRERARAESHRVQMETAASTGVMLCERLGDGTALLIIPPTARPDQAVVTRIMPGGPWGTGR